KNLVAGCVEVIGYIRSLWHREHLKKLQHLRRDGTIWDQSACIGGIEQCSRIAIRAACLFVRFFVLGEVTRTRSCATCAHLRRRHGQQYRAIVGVANATIVSKQEQPVSNQWTA